MTLKERIHSWMTGREEEFLEALALLIAVNSVTGEAAPGMPFGPSPAKALELALELAEKWGMRTWSDEGYVGLADLNDKEDLLHILAHLDIVAAGDHWDTDPFVLTREGDLIYGRGVDDDKGPAVASLLAMRCVKELGIPLKGNVKMILGTDEETGSGDLKHYFAAHPFAPYSITPDSTFPVTNIEKAGYAPRFGISWDPRPEVDGQLLEVHGGIRINVAPGNCTAKIRNISLNTVQPVLDQVSAATGVTLEAAEDSGIVTIEATGSQSHASAPDGGKNAIAAMLQALNALPLAQDAAAKAVSQLHALFPYGDNGGKALGIAMEDEVSGKLTVAFSLLDLDASGCHARFDCRAPLCATPENTKAVTEKVFADLGWTCTGNFNPAHAVDGDSPFVRTLLETYEEFSGRKGYCEAIGGGTYVHYIPGGVAFGAGERDFASNLHSANERAKISQLLLTAEIYAAVIVRLCGEE